MALALAASYFLATGSNSSSQTVTTTSFTPAVNELIVLKAMSEDNAFTLNPPTATGGGITWTKQIETTTANTCRGILWTGIVTVSTSITVSISNTSNGGYFSAVVERWTGAQLAATPAVVSAAKNDPYTLQLSTLGDSVISYADGDWKAIPPGTPTYSAANSVSEGIDDESSKSAYVAYFDYQTATSSGTQTFGVTSPLGRNSMVMGIEIQVATGGPAVVNHSLMMMGIGG
jgi:hypothetical protein